jgi:hypothetical protein
MIAIFARIYEAVAKAFTKNALPSRPAPAVAVERTLTLTYIRCTRELSIIHRTLTDPEYSYGCMRDADATTSLTDLVARLACECHAALGGTDDVSLSVLIGDKWKNAFTDAAPTEKPPTGPWLVNSAARRGLELGIIRCILTEEDYAYDCGMDADYSTPLTDLVNAVAVAYRNTLSAGADTPIEALLALRSNLAR